MGKARYKDYRCHLPLFVMVLMCLHQTSSQPDEKATPPEITRQIYMIGKWISTIIPSGSYLYLVIDAHGTAPLRYIWSQNGTVVQNDTVASYKITTGLRESHSGIYRVTVENIYGKVRSLSWTLTVRDTGLFANTSDTVVNVLVGKSALLTMPEISYVNVKDAFTVEWQKNDVAIRDSDGMGFYVTLDYNLVLLNIPRSFNENRFRVKFTQAAAANVIDTYSHYFVLNVTEPSQNTPTPPEFVVRPQNTSAESGQIAKMECVVNGQPLESVQITWYQVTGSGQRQTITQSSKYSLTAYNRLLTISALDTTDSAAYECEGSLKAQTVYSNITQKATLTVLVPPTISKVSTQISKDFQEFFSLSCIAQGYPQPEKSWYFNDKKLVSSDTTRYQIDVNDTLSIANVDSPDSGVYQCFAVNEAGESATYTWLSVNSAKPTITDAPKNATVIEHETTAFTCKVTGGPQPEVFWKKDGVNVTNGFQAKDQLVLSQVRKSDSGLYSCNAVNIKGTASASATLTVIAKTLICKPPQNMSRILSTDVMLDCGVCKDDSVTPSWTWYFYPVIAQEKQNVTSGLNGVLIYPNGSLGITGVLSKHSGKYECLVTSDGGNDQKTAVLSVFDKPSKPIVTAVALYDQIPNSVSINWTLPDDGNSPVIKFIIDSRRESSSGSSIDFSWETVNSSVSADLRYTVISNLLPSRHYRFRVTALNKAGYSDPSEAAPTGEAIKMPAQPPSAAPLNLFCEARPERAIVVKWEPPPTWNGDLLGFLIYYKIVGYPDDTEKVKNISGKDVRETIIDSLVYYKPYSVHIAAYNEKGPGKNSSDFNLTTLQGRPDAPPLNVTLVSPSSTEIRVEWKAPPLNYLNGVNQGYNIELSQNGSLKNTINVRYDEQNPTERQIYTITNLSKYTEYMIQIACKTGAGAGPKSPSQTIRTLEDVPGHVTELKIDNISDRSMRVNWKPPQEVNGVLLGYEVTIQEKNTSLAESFNRTANYTSHTFNNLKYETAYVIYVRARTRMGLGPPSTTEIVSGVPPELPKPPTQLAVTNIEARSVLLQFAPGYDGKTSITLWIVEAQIDGSSSWYRVHNISDPTADQIAVHNLRPYTSYRLRIIAQNIVGNSVPSEATNLFQTRQDVPGMPPQDVTPRANNSTSIRIRWIPIPRSEWNGDFLGYRILYRRWGDVDVNTTSQADIDLVRQSSWTVVSLNNGSSTQEYFLTKLEEWMDYQIQMLSYNAVGNSSASATLSERTEEDVPSVGPRNVVSTSKSSTAIFVSWSPVPILQQNGNIQGYKIKYVAVRTGAEPQYMEVAGAKSLNATLTGLWKYTQYNIQVLASTRVGDGALSNVISVRTESDVPGPPIIIYFPQVNETSATVVWQSPEEPNGKIVNYKVSYKLKYEPDSVFSNQTKDLESTVFQYTVNGLSALTTYVFAVQARTQDGWGEAAMVDVFTIANRERPDPPENLKIDTSEVLARSVTIMWTVGKDNFGPIRNYTVQYRKQGENWQTVEGTIKPQLTSYTVKGLQPNTVYSFRVAAVNDIGMSDFSDVSKDVRTQPAQPDGSPQNVTVTAVTRTSIKITWLPPPESTWNGHPANDIVQYREEGTQTFRESTVQFGVFSATLQELTIDMRYEIQVLTLNEAGRGPPSILQLFLVGDVAPFDPPSDIRVTNKSSTELEITWKPPPDDSTNGKLTGYNVHYWQSASSKCELTATISKSYVTDLSIVLANLKPYTIYCSTVQALNIAGEGPQSQPVPKQTSEDLPSAPQNVSCRNITLRELTIFWDAPRTPNGNITHYQLQYFTSIDSENTAVSTRNLPGEERHQYISDLLENQRYNFTLAAINSIGKGAMATISVVTGPQPGSPAAPLQPVVTYKMKTINLSWTNQGEGRSPIERYHICYQEEGKPGNCVPILDVNHVDPAAQISLSALKPGTKYSFVVRAINSYGISPPSASSELFETPGSLVKAQSGPFHTQWWFLVIVALSGVIIILLVITFLCCLHRRRKKGNELKRSTTITTVMSSTPEPEETRFPALELRQSTRSIVRNGKVQNNTNNVYARSPPRPSPASVTYAEGLNLPIIAGASAAAARKPHIADDASSVLSDKPSNLGDSTDDSSDDSDDSSTDSIVKAPVPSSPPPPAFSSHYNRSSSSNNNSSSARTSGGSSSNHPLHTKNHNTPWKGQQPHNAYTYTDSEADSSHYAFSFNNGNIVVNNVAGARTPLSGFSSFV